ncbi:MAG TPA: serine/threonine-protein kinase, partial [Aggregatilineales bacterium]|nr:serine/threonine-protein kinase [Aggregatilineales bacterium]
MNIPQVGRKPLPTDDSNARAHLKKRNRQDKTDPFVTDPNPEIQVLGKLALRRNDINDLFALGDLCALQSHSPDNRLLVYYIGKALIAYKRALTHAVHEVDRKTARRAIDEYLRWLFDFAECHPIRRNIAAALWAATDDEDQPETRPTFQRHLIGLLDSYRQKLSTKTAVAKPKKELPANEDDEIDADAVANAEADIDNDSTHADFPPPLLASDASMTIADTGAIIEFQSNIVESQFISETQAEESAVFDQTSFEGNHDMPSVKPTASVKTDPDNPPDSTDEDPENVIGGDYSVGDRIDGRYEVSEVLRGGMGVVYLCYDHDQREPVAIKTFQSKYLENERALTRFNHEATVWVRLEKHRHIVQARLVQDISKRPHFILEYVSGTEELGSDLRSWIEHRKLDLTTTVEYALHIALGMQHATSKVSGLVHRDLKPANILVTHDHIAKVTDFGLVHSVDLTEISTAELEKTPADEHLYPSDRLTKVGAIVGTAPYMSPEQCQSKEVDMRSDIYSFGCVLYEMLTGKRVFRARKFSEWMMAHLNEKPSMMVKDKRAIPDKLQQFVLKCLEKNPIYRPQNWGDIVAYFTDLYTEITGKAPEVEVTGPALEARELMDKGYSLTALKRYDEAITAYDQAIALKPDYAWAWARKGRTYRLLERYEEAIACYDRAIAILPRYAFAWNGKGIVLERMKQLDDALRCYEIATEHNPNDVWYWFNRANVLYDLERFKEAIPLLERALQIDPKHPNSWAKLGQIHRVMKNYPESAKAYEQAIHLDPAYAWAYNGCGLVYKAMGRLQEAVTVFRRAARYMPNEVWHWYNLTDTLVEMGNYRDALQPAEEATRTDPNHAFSWAKLGQVFRHLRRLPEALTAYDRALALDNDSAWSINGKGIVLEQMERYAEAHICYARAAELKPNDVWHW